MITTILGNIDLISFIVSPIKWFTYFFTVS